MIQTPFRGVIGKGLVGLSAAVMLLAGFQGYRVQAAAALPVQTCVGTALSSAAGHLALVSVLKNQQSITLANADGSGRTCVATLASTAQVQLPAWSPDGKYIAFVLVYTPDG